MSDYKRNIGKHLQKEIKARRELEYNIPLFFNECSALYYAYAGIQFAMEFYDFYEGSKDGDKLVSKGAQEILKEITAVLEESLLTSFDGGKRETNIKRIFRLREKVTRKMQQFTVYVDRFLIYEYILERIAPGFLPEVESIEDEKAVSELLAYIFDGKDNAVIIQKVREVIYHLPVRMTKNRFYELLKDNLLRYQDSNIQTVEDFIYMIRSTAGLLTPDEKNPEMEKTLEKFRSVDYREIKKNEFDELHKELSEVTALLTAETNTYYAAQEMINHLLACLLNVPYAGGEQCELVHQLFPLMKEVKEGMELLFDSSLADHMGRNEITAEAVDLFRLIEGKLEMYSEELSRIQTVFEEVDVYEKENPGFLEHLMLQPVYECLKLSEKLTANSLFIGLEEQADTQHAESKYLEKKAAELSGEFAEKFSGQSQIVNRAMIAAVLKELPVFLNSRTEISDYIKGALSGCHDMAERAACMRLIRQDMEQE